MKNKRFFHKYSVMIEGTTTNNFSSDSFLLTLQVLVDAWNKRHKTSQAQVLKVEDTNVL